MYLGSYADRDAPLHSERVDAFERVQRAVTTGANVIVVEHGDTRRTMDHAAAVLRAFELDGIADVRRGGDPGRTEALVTMAGRRMAVERTGGGLALFPLHGALRIVERPPQWPHDVDLATRTGRGRLRAVAPEHHDEDVRASSAVIVVLDPVPDWSEHPTYRARRHGAGDAIRVWEVFTMGGQSHGLLLMTDRGFDGVEPDGSISPDRSPGGAAWEIVMNS